MLETSAPASGTKTKVPDAAEPNSSVERNAGITNFIDAEDTLVDLTHATRTLTTSMLMSNDDSTQDIRKVLERPIFMDNVDWSSSDTLGTILKSYKLPDDILLTSSIKIEKMQYNTFLNCDIVMRVIAAPMQLQAGRLWLAFEPYQDERGSRSTQGYPSQFTSLAGVEYDPSKPAPVELRIPFQSILSSYDLTAGQFGCGSVQLWVLSPLTSATTTSTVTVSVQAWLENVQLRVPTQFPKIPGPTLFTRNKARVDYIHGEPQRYQSREDHDANKHTFSRAAAKISSIASFLGEFPLLASVAKPVASFASAISSTAAYFGFAKPADISAPAKIVNHNRSAWVNSDGPLPLVKLSHTSDNEVTQQDHIFPNQADEMDIGYIVSNPAMLYAWNWSTTDNVGQLITVIPVHPGVAQIVSGPGTYTSRTFMPTPVAYVASMFKYWAGSMKYRLECVSTPFHAGRLVVAYFPNYDPLANYSITEIGNNYSVVWDITDSSHLEFEVPYISNKPYQQVFLDDQAFTVLKNGETTGTAVRDRCKQVMNGAIVVFVLNKLVAPEAAAPTITVLNWIAGGKDLTFAEPVLGAYKPVSLNTQRIDYTGKWYDGTEMSPAPYPVPPTRSLETIEEVDEVDAPQQYQSNAPTNMSTPGIDPKGISTAQRGGESNFIPMSYIDPQSRARLAFGETITNLRTLTRRLTPAYVMYPQDVTNAGAWDPNVVPPTSLNVLTIDPDYFGTGDGFDDACLYGKQIAPARPGGPNWITELSSSLSYISYLYAFARGSRVYGISSTPSATINAGEFTELPDEDRQTGDRGQGTWEMRLSLHNDVDSPPRQPYFRPEDYLLGYNYANNSSSTLSATNYQYGFNSALSGNMAVVKSGESGCALVAQVPPTSPYPYRLIAESPLNEVGYISTIENYAPRSRRFLEIRYRPFQSSLSGDTSTIKPKVWPFPTTIMEAGADDFSFGGLVPPPLITKVTKHNVFPNYSTGAKLLL